MLASDLHPVASPLSSLRSDVEKQLESGFLTWCHMDADVQYLSHVSTSSVERKVNWSWGMMNLWDQDLNPYSPQGMISSGQIIVTG